MSKIQAELIKSKIPPKPKYVITDSQAFNEVKEIVPESIILTSFSILMANYRGKLDELISGASKISELEDGNRLNNYHSIIKGM